MKTNQNYNNIIFSKNNKVAKISLNRADVLNSFNYAMADELIDALEKCKEDDEVRAVIFSGEGRAFCAGQDLQEATGENSPGIDEIIEHTYNPIIKYIREMPKPVICAVNGVAAGAGANIAIACDITFAKSSAKFIQAFVNIGLVPDSAGTFFLPKLIGLQRAAGLMFTGDKISAEEAEKIGMIYKCVPDDEFETVVDSFAKKIAEKPTKTIALIKDLLNQSNSNNWIQQLELEKKNQKIAADSNDHREGITAFFEKRKPEYKGN